MLNDEASATFKNAIKENGMKYELVPPGNHQHNITEQAIQTFKNHFIYILWGVSENFPMHLWCRILPQAEMAINMMRQSNTMPKISAYTYLNGIHSFSRRSLAPLGYTMQTHTNGQASVVGNARCRRVLQWHVPTASLMIHCLDQENKGRKSVRHNLRQTQIYHTVHNHTGGRSHPGGKG